LVISGEYEYELSGVSLMRKALQRLGLDNKTLAAIIFCVMLFAAALPALIIKRETSLLESNNRKTSQILATAMECYHLKQIHTNHYPNRNFDDKKNSSSAR
jgi:hypothetical protein